jgi:tetratricopeptide (TPR) repeat protein
VTEPHIVARPGRAPQLEVERVRSRLAAKLYGVAEASPKIAHYEIVERIGFGAQGDVYLVHDPRLDRRLAIKVLRRDVGADGIAEARALAQVVHPNVVPVFDVGVLAAAGDEGPRAYIVMEYVAGKPLHEWCTRSVAWADRLRVLVAAGRGLAAAHAVGIVHGDFKPSNVVVGDDHRPRVMDFGLARWRPDAPTSPGETTGRGGTPGYRAPECDDGPMDARSDQFSFCTTAWQLLVDQPAEPAPRRAELVEIRAILQRGLRPRPEDRWPDLAQLLGRLDRVAGSRRGWGRVAIAASGGALAAWWVATSGTAVAEDRDIALATAGIEVRAVEARLWLARGKAEWNAGRTADARAAFERAAHLAGAVGDDRTSAEAALMLADLLGRRMALFEEARRWEPHARAAIARLGDRELEAKLDLRWGVVLALAGDPDGGREVLHGLRERLEIDPSIAGVATVDVDSALSRLETQAGRSLEALEAAERAVAGQAARVGKQDPAYAEALVRLGVAQEQRADLDAARRSLEEALAIYEREGNEAGSLGTRNSLAVVLERQGDLDAAAREYRLVLQAATEQHMDDMAVMVRANLGALELARRDADAALEHLTIARAAAEDLFPASHQIFTTIHYGLGVAHGRRDEGERAVTELERAIELATARGMDEAHIGKFRYVLGQARALSEDPDERKRGRTEVEEGLAELKKDPSAFGEEIAEAEAWLKKH